MSRNSIHSVLFLILSFVAAACLNVMAASEFYAFLLIIVYVGAVAVMLLFVLMMLNDSDIPKNLFILPGAALYSLAPLAMLAEILVAFNDSELQFASKPQLVSGYPVGGIYAFGMVMYDRYLIYFQMCGLILTLAVVGAMALVLSRDMKRDVSIKTQSLSHQRARDPKKSIRLVNIPSQNKIEE